MQARGDRRVCHAPALARGSWAMARLLDDVRYRMLTQAADNRNWLVDWHATCGDHA